MASEIQQNWTDGICKRFQISSPEYPRETHQECIYSIHLRSPYLVSGSKDGQVRVWNVDTQSMIQAPLRSHKSAVLCVQFDDSSGEDVIISGSTDCSFIVWRFSTDEVLRRATSAHDESILSLCFDGVHLVTGSKDRVVKIWNRREIQRDDHTIPAYSELHRLEGHIAAVNVVKIHENTVVSGGGDRTIHIWNIETGQKVRTLTDHTKGIACLQYNGRFIVSGSSDNTVRIFDLERPGAQERVACFQAHASLVRAIQFQSRGLESQPERIFSGSYDGSVKVWHFDAEAEKWKSHQTLVLEDNGTGDLNRIFGIQFDERRLLCCSQQNVITGWDFGSSEDTANKRMQDA